MKSDKNQPLSSRLTGPLMELYYGIPFTIRQIFKREHFNPADKSKMPVAFIPGVYAPKFFYKPFLKLLKASGLTKVTYCGAPTGKIRGFNKIDFDSIYEQVVKLAKDNDNKISLIGHSMGGLFIAMIKERLRTEHPEIKLNNSVIIASPIAAHLDEAVKKMLIAKLLVLRGNKKILGLFTLPNAYQPNKDLLELAVTTQNDMNSILNGILVFNAKGDGIVSDSFVEDANCVSVGDKKTTHITILCKEVAKAISDFLIHGKLPNKKIDLASTKSNIIDVRTSKVSIPDFSR